MMNSRREIRRSLGQAGRSGVVAGCRTLLAVLCLLLAPLGVPAHSEGIPETIEPRDEMLLFQELPSVYGASRFEQKLTEAPASVTIVTATDIKKYGYRTVADVLQGTPGFFTTYDRNYAYVGVRGFTRPGDYNTRVLLLVDGHRINDNVYDQAFIGTDFPVDIDLVDHIEIIRGPGSSIYGSNAFFGVINVITRRGRDIKGFELSGEGGSFDTYKGRVSYGNRFSDGLEMLVSGSYYTSFGQDLFFKEFNRPVTNNGIANNCDYDRFSSFFSKFSLQDFTLEGVFHSRDKGIPTAPWGTVFNDPRTSSTDQRAYLDLHYDRTFANDLGVMARLFYDHYHYDDDFPYDLATPPRHAATSIFIDRTRGDWFGTEVQLSKTFFDKHHLIIGTESRVNPIQDQKGFSLGEFQPTVDITQQSYNLGFFLQDEFRIRNDLIFNAGVRHDYYETFGGTTNPRLALIYLPFDQTALKLLYGTAFRAPNGYELYYDDGGITAKANPDLKPETIHLYELVWEQQLGKHLRMSTSGFYYTVDNLISQQLDPTDQLLVFRNTAEIEAKGVEIELDGRWPRDLQTRLSYAWQDVRDTETGDLLTGSPHHVAKAGLIVPILQEKLFAGIELRYLGPRRSLLNKEIDYSFITNVTLFTHNIVKGLEFSASVYNLFDAEYGDPGAGEHLQDIIPQDGRVFRLKLTYSF